MRPLFTTDTFTWLQAVKDPCACTPDSHTSKPSSDLIRRTLIQRLERGSLIATLPVINDLRYHAGFPACGTVNPVQPCCKLHPHEIGRLQPVIHALSRIAKLDPETCAWQTGRFEGLHDETIRRIRADLVAAELLGASRSKEHEAFSRSFLESKWLSGIPECNQSPDSPEGGISHHQWEEQLAGYDQQLWQAASSAIKSDGSIPAGMENTQLQGIQEKREHFNASSYRRLWTDLHLLLIAAERAVTVVSANPNLSILGLYTHQPVIMIPHLHEPCDIPWNALETALYQACDRQPDSHPEESEPDIIFTDSDPDALRRLIANLGD